MGIEMLSPHILSQCGVVLMTATGCFGFLISQVVLSCFDYEPWNDRIHVRFLTTMIYLGVGSEPTVLRAVGYSASLKPLLVAHACCVAAASMMYFHAVQRESSEIGRKVLAESNPNYYLTELCTALCPMGVGSFAIVASGGARAFAVCNLMMVPITMNI